jgi:hypothetical protein
VIIHVGPSPGVPSNTEVSRSSIPNRSMSDQGVTEVQRFLGREGAIHRVGQLGEPGPLREGGPNGWSTLYGAYHRVGQLGETGPLREGGPKGWSTMLITALGSWEFRV